MDTRYHTQSHRENKLKQAKPSYIYKFSDCHFYFRAYSLCIIVVYSHCWLEANRTTNTGREPPLLSTLTPLWIYVIFIHELLMCSAAAAPCLCLWFWSLPASSGNNNLLYSMSCKEVNQYLAVCGHGVIWSSLNVDRYPNTDNLSCRYSGLTQLSRCM